MPRKPLAIIAALVLSAAFLAGCLSVPKPYEDNASPVMFFYSDVCPHCAAMKPILTKLSDQGYRVKPMDVQANKDYWNTYSIDGTPTWIAANGDRLVGEQSEYGLQTWLEAHGAKIRPPKPQ